MNDTTASCYHPTEGDVAAFTERFFKGQTADALQWFKTEWRPEWDRDPRSTTWQDPLADHLFSIQMKGIA